MKTYGGVLTDRPTVWMPLILTALTLVSLFPPGLVVLLPFFVEFPYRYLLVSRDSAVGIVPGYGLDD
jgi:hypothetical protein